MIGTGRGGPSIFLAASVVLVLFAVGAGLYMLGSPAAVRAQRLDEQRLDQLRNCASGIASYLSDYDRLPATIGDIGLACDYTPRAGTTYELCAVFEREGALRNDTRWQHGPGRACFLLDARSHSPVPQAVRR